MNIDHIRCPNCNGVHPYHNLPCNGGLQARPCTLSPLPYLSPPPHFYPPLPDDKNPGCEPLKQLTETDVRRIVREELAKQREPLMPPTIGGKP